MEKNNNDNSLFLSKETTSYYNHLSTFQTLHRQYQFFILKESHIFHPIGPYKFSGHNYKLKQLS